MSSMVVQKHSRPPRKANPDAKPPRALTVAKKPLYAIPEEKRGEIARGVLDRYLLGEQVVDIATEVGTSDVTIYALLLREFQDEWRDIQTARALARLEISQDDLNKAREAMRVAPDTLSLARERDRARVSEMLVRSAQWELERLLKRLYGNDQQVNVAVTVDLGERLRRARERVIEPLDVVGEPA